MRSTELGCFRLHSWSLWKALEEEGCICLVSCPFELAVKKFLNIEWFLHRTLKLNHSWKFRRYWNVPLVLLGRSWWVGFNGVYLVRFGFRMWEIIDFEMISATENSNTFQKSRSTFLEGKINWGRGNTIAPSTRCPLLLSCGWTSTELIFGYTFVN